MTRLTFYGGVGEIGGNKILVEDKGTKVFLDFGMQMARVNEYSTSFQKPRRLSGLGDMFEFDLLPNIQGIYRKDYTKHMNSRYSTCGILEGDHKKANSIDGVLLSHAHIDHCSYIHYLRPNIPIYCSEATKLIMQCLQDTGGDDQYIDFKENFQLYKNTKDGLSQAISKKNREELKRKIKVVKPNKIFKIDSLSIEPIPVDHSLPGVYGFLIHTSQGSIGYTADMRFHGRRSADSEKFVERCHEEDVDCLLCEGTRIDKFTLKTEQDVEKIVTESISDVKNLIVCTYPMRDLDRLVSFYNAAKSLGRYLTIDTKQAYLLNLIQGSSLKESYPSPDDPHIRIFIQQRYWGLLDHMKKEYASYAKLDYKQQWEKDLLDHENITSYKDIKNKQNKHIFYCSDFQLANLIDIRPKEGSRYIRSQTEPFDDEMALDQRKTKRWLVHFGLVPDDNQPLETVHVSGHGGGDAIAKIITGVDAKTVIPIHTENEDAFDSLAKNVSRVSIGGNYTL